MHTTKNWIMSENNVDKAKGLILDYVRSGGKVHLAAKAINQYGMVESRPWLNNDTMRMITSVFDTALPEFLRENMSAGARALLQVFFEGTSWERDGERFAILRQQHRLRHEPTAGVTWTSDLDRDIMLEVSIHVHTVSDTVAAQSPGCFQFINDVCSTCLEKFTLADTIVCLPCCHLFHKECITSWRASGQSLGKYCPMKCGTRPYTEWKIGHTQVTWSKELVGN